MTDRPQPSKLEIELEISADGSDDHLIDTLLNSGKVTKLCQDGEDVSRKYLRLKFQSVSDMVEDNCWPEMQSERQELPAVIEPDPPASYTDPNVPLRHVDGFGMDLSKIQERIQTEQAIQSEVLEKIKEDQASLEALRSQIQADQARANEVLERIRAELAFQSSVLQEIRGPRTILGNMGNKH